MRRILFVLIIAASLLPTVAMAQQGGLYSNRLLSKDGKWLLPVATLHLGSTERDHLNRGSVQAWDLVAPGGSPVFPIASGIVEYAGCNNRGGYGCWTFIRHAGGIKTIMAHCIEGSIRVASGQAVEQWTVVCQVGMTGMTSFGPHTHLEIHKAGGGRYNVSDFWDIGAMQYQKLGNTAQKEVVTKIGIVTSSGQVAQGTAVGQPAAAVPQPAPVAAARPMASINLDAIGLSLLVMAFFLLRWAFSGKGNGLLRDAAAAAVIISMPVWLPMMFLRMATPGNAAPVAASVPAPVSSAAVPGGVAWKLAYDFMRKWEGSRTNPRCVHDPVRTLSGITQGTYDAWTKSKGYPRADVCASLTEAQAEAIYYERYWLASGADRLPPTIAIAHFDHAVNAGVSAANRLLGQCGTDANCYVRARYADYRTKGNCAQYCRAWFNRVDDMIKYINDLAKKGS
jgi:murein DD-endopeptidase MepM/ murein hydrolase activator NlpD